MPEIQLSEEEADLLMRAAEYASREMGGRRSPEEIARMMLLLYGPEGLAELVRAVRGPTGVHRPPQQPELPANRPRSLMMSQQESDFERRCRIAERLVKLRLHFIRKYGRNDPRTQKFFAYFNRKWRELGLSDC